MPPSQFIYPVVLHVDGPEVSTSITVAQAAELLSYGWTFGSLNLALPKLTSASKSSVLHISALKKVEYFFMFGR